MNHLNEIVKFSRADDFADTNLLLIDVNLRSKSKRNIKTPKFTYQWEVYFAEKTSQIPLDLKMNELLNWDLNSIVGLDFWQK